MCQFASSGCPNNEPATAPDAPGTLLDTFTAWPASVPVSRPGFVYLRSTVVSWVPDVAAHAASRDAIRPPPVMMASRRPIERRPSVMVCSRQLDLGKLPDETSAGPE